MLANELSSQNTPAQSKWQRGGKHSPSVQLSTFSKLLVAVVSENPVWLRAWEMINPHLKPVLRMWCFPQKRLCANKPDTLTNKQCFKHYCRLLTHRYVSRTVARIKHFLLQLHLTGLSGNTAPAARHDVQPGCLPNSPVQVSPAPVTSERSSTSELVSNATRLIHAPHKIFY